VAKRQRDLKKRCGQQRLQPSTTQKPQFNENPGVIHAMGKEEMPGAEVKPGPSISPPGREGQSALAGWFEDGGRFWAATPETWICLMPGIKLVRCQTLHPGCRGWGKPLAVSGIWSRVVESLTQPPARRTRATASARGQGTSQIPQGPVLLMGSPTAMSLPCWANLCVSCLKADCDLSRVAAHSHFRPVQPLAER